MFQTIIAFSLNSIVVSGRNTWDIQKPSSVPSYHPLYSDNNVVTSTIGHHMTIIPTKTINKCKAMYCSEWSDREWCNCYNNKYDKDYIKYGCKDDGEVLLC